MIFVNSLLKITMQRPYNDRWERTRRHLLRNLLDYHGDLSPIPEESRSESSDDRPASPLPELVVEPEPDRHDHDKQFYEELAVRMRRYYRRLFIDGVSVHEAGLYDADDISSEFEVNQSMASTFIIDTNNRTAEKRPTITSPKSIDYAYDQIMNEDEPGAASKNVATQSTYLSEEEISETSGVMDITDDKEAHSGIQEPSPSDVVTNENESEVNSTGNHTHEAQISEKASKSTESDLAQSCHRTITTVAQVHSEQRLKAPRVFEDGSPVLLPKAHELSRRIFGKARNILSAANDDVEEDSEKNDGEEPEIEEDEQAQDEDLEGEWLMKSADSMSNANQESIESCEEEEIYKDTEKDQTSPSTSVELFGFDDQDLKTSVDENGSSLQTSESDGEIRIQNEESIGPNEFDHIERSRSVNHTEIHGEEVLEPDANSFEMAIRKGLFESKNARKTAITSSDEEFEDKGSESEEFEPVEVMRGTMQTRLTETLRRESTVSKDSPLEVNFVTQATTERIEGDDPDHDDTQIDASHVAMTETRAEDGAELLETALTDSLDSSVADESKSHVEAEKLSSSDNLECSDCAFNAPVDGDHEANKDADGITPSIAKTHSIADVCNDIWSVSPVLINFEELPPKDLDVITPDCKKKKRVSDSDADVNALLNKKKKYNNIAIQTGASKESACNWKSLKNNFLVGNPLVYRLCKCHDHVCP